MIFRSLKYPESCSGTRFYYMWVFALVIKVVVFCIYLALNMNTHYLLVSISVHLCLKV